VRGRLGNWPFYLDSLTHNVTPGQVTTGKIKIREELLDNVMFYWLTGSGASSARLYWESFNLTFGGKGGNPVKLPVGCSIFPKEIVPTPRSWAELRYKNIVYWNELNKGGHFAAFEQPGLFVSELRDCFRLMR